MGAWPSADEVACLLVGEAPTRDNDSFHHHRREVWVDGVLLSRGHKFRIATEDLRAELIQDVYGCLRAELHPHPVEARGHPIVRPLGFGGSLRGLMARRGEAAGRESRRTLRAVPAPGKCCTEERGHRLVLLEVQPLDADMVGR